MHILKLRTLTSLVALGLSLSLATSVAKAKSVNLPGITVTATSLGGQETDASRVGSSVSVITARDIERQQFTHISDVLRNLPGVSVSRSGSYAGQTQVRMRGAESNHVLVIVDGIEMNTATEGEFDFSNLSAENIERIEVIRGPQSGLYGSNALAGVISITTKTGKGPLQATIKTEAGTSNTKSANVNVSGGNAKVHGSLSVNTYKSDGFNIAPIGSEKDSAERTNILFKGGIKPIKNLDLNFVINKVDKKGDFDPDNNFDGELEDNAFTRFSTDLLTLGVNAKLKTLDGRWVHNVKINRQTTENSTLNGVVSVIDSETTKLSYVNTLRLDAPSFYGSRHFLSGLIEHEEQSFVQDGGAENKRNENSYALQYRGEFADQLYVSASIRKDDNDAFGDFTTYKLSGAWKIPQTGVRLHSNLGTGVVNPALFEQYGTFLFFVPNPDLTPEESFGWDAGVEWTSPNKKHVLDITYFNQDLQNEIAFNTLFGPGIPTLVNLDGTSKRQGIEVSWKGRLTNSLSVGAAYTYLDSKDADGNIEVRRPKHSGKINANYRFDDGKGNLNLGVNYNGKNKDFYFPPFPATRQVVTLDDYVLVSLAGSYKIQPNVELFGRVENLIDEDYQEIFGFETPGISAYAGIKIKLGPNE